MDATNLHKCARTMRIPFVYMLLTDPRGLIAITQCGEKQRLQPSQSTARYRYSNGGGESVHNRNIQTASTHAIANMIETNMVTMCVRILWDHESRIWVCVQHAILE